MSRSPSSSRGSFSSKRLSATVVHSETFLNSFQEQNSLQRGEPSCINPDRSKAGEREEKNTTVGSNSAALDPFPRRFSSDSPCLPSVSAAILLSPGGNSEIDSNSLLSAVEIPASAPAPTTPRSAHRASPVLISPSLSSDRTPLAKKLQKQKVGFGLGLDLGGDEIVMESSTSGLSKAQQSAREMSRRLGLEEEGDGLGIDSIEMEEEWSGKSSNPPSHQTEPSSTIQLTSTTNPSSPNSIRSLSPSPSYSLNQYTNGSTIYGGSSAQLAAPILSRSHSNSSINSNSSFFTAISVSPTLSRPTPLLAGGFTMDRSISSTSSIHSRHASLTTACAPVTAGFLTPDNFGGSGSGIFTAQNSPSIAQRVWSGLDLDARGKEDKEELEDESRKVRSGSGYAFNVENLILSILELPTNLLYIFLSPLSTASTTHAYSPQLSGSTVPTLKPSSAARRFSLPIRLFTILYLVFSAIFLSFSLTRNVFTASGSNSRIKSIAPRGPTDLQFNRMGPSEVFRLGLISIGDERTSFGLGDWVGKAVNWKSKKEDIEERQEIVGVGAGDIARIGAAAITSKVPKTNPLTPLTHTYRFAKMFDKVSRELHDEIEPFAFKATRHWNLYDTTACLYSNEAWLSILPEFVKAWNGPISLVFEISHSRHSPLRANLVATINDLRSANNLIREQVDFHLVGVPNSMPEKSLNKLRERLLLRPIAKNFHHNLARFFAPTEIIWAVGDARILPSTGLFQRLREGEIKDLVIDRGDVVVVPTFGFVRDRTGGVSNLPSLATSRKKLGLLPITTSRAGVGSVEFTALGKENVRVHFDSLPIPPSRWPTRKSTVVSLVSTRPGTQDIPSSATLALYDEAWDLNRGPTNWYLWRKTAADPRLSDLPSAGGGYGLGLNNSTGGGDKPFRITDYDLHYSPALIMSTQGQPWCTERFDSLKSACTYQLYLTGAEFWVLPDEWIFTLESIERVDEKIKEDPALKLKNSISARLFNKFHQESCMHYGREFLSMQMWNSEKSQHLRSTCAKVLASWGMGL